MAKIVRLNQPRRVEMNYDFEAFNRFVLANIKAGYLDKKRQIHIDQNADDVDVENNYQLQRPAELLESKVGWCFDLVELYREYAFCHKLSAKSYFMEYYDEKKHLHFVSAFILVQQRDGLWYTCADNLQSEYAGNQTFETPRDAVSKCFYDFKHYVKEVVDQPNRSYFYINEYPVPEKAIFEGKIEITDWCRIEQFIKEDSKYEISAMAIVFAKDDQGEYRVLLLKTNHHEWVFPKGHLENNEGSKEAAMRECFEESHVDLKNADYLGYVDKYKYHFDSYDLEMTNEMFYELFGAIGIEKRVEVHAFYLDHLVPIQWQKEERFIEGDWIKLSNARKVIAFENTWELYKKAYNKFYRRYIYKPKNMADVIKDVFKIKK